MKYTHRGTEKAFDAREDVQIARRIASLCNGDVENNITNCGLLELGIDKLRRIDTIIGDRDPLPDLLAACEAALDSEPCRYDHDGDCQSHRLGNPCEQKLLREAIAKAKGGASS